MEGSQYSFPVGRLSVYSNSSIPSQRLMKTILRWLVVMMAGLY
jgi:hypothetical protein